MKSFILFMCFVGWAFGEMESGSFMFEGHNRNYQVFIPTNFEQNAPLVFNLHGYDLTADFNINYLRMNEVADTAGFIVVYPDAISRIWNSGIGDSPTWPAPDIDDVSFLSALIDTIHSCYQIDLNRVHSCGFSNGGFMSLRLAAELPERFRSVASVVGVLTPTVVSIADTSTSIPIMMMFGTNDVVVPFDGGVEGWLSGPETIQYWIDHHGLSSEVDSLLLPDIDIHDGSEVKIFPYGNIAGETAVLVYQVVGGGHKWPGGVNYPGFGSMNFDISASEEIWKFFVNEGYDNNDVWIYDLQCDNTSYTPAIDSIVIKGGVSNFNSSEYTAFAHIFDESSVLVDSIQLYDDGLHHDNHANDGIVGNIILAPDTEAYWSAQVTSFDHSKNLYMGLYDNTVFTTHAGLSSLDVRQVHPTGGVIQPNSTVYFFFSLQNHNEVSSISDIEVKIVPNDSSSFSTGFEYASFPEIAAGEITESLNYVALRIADGVDEGTPILFNIEIRKDGVKYWENTNALLGHVSIFENSNQRPTSFLIEQNYPNPFNPTTTLRYGIPEETETSLFIYDLLGNRVNVLSTQTQVAGWYQYTWDGLNAFGQPVSSGVYIARFRASTYSQTIKMVYMK